MRCQISPLLLAIRSNYVDIVKILLKYGVDPNNSQKSKTGQRTFAVSVALNRENYNCFILLILMGAKTDKVKCKKIPREKLRQIKEYSCKPVKKGKHPYAEKISELNQFCSDFSDEVQHIKVKITTNSDYSDLSFVDGIAYIRELYQKAIVLVEDIIKLNNKLKEDRTPLIDKQIIVYDKYIGNQVINSLVLSEIFPEETIKIIKKRRQKLYEYGISVSRLNSLSTFAFNVFQTLREYTNEYYYSIQKTLEVAEEKMTKTINNQNLLLRAGLSNPQCDMLQTLLPLKIKTLQRQREPIEQNFKQFREMNNDLCKSMRQCYK
ncbi:hypothetical protein TVAG_273620 [Trichomonas vaginalis G3]|uniref:Uncharacterized protein n=1 Tax=Trichomonas vaginalis (strain ATCC PRA-98 / G3) TaxID=412133 RepID=A2EI39_TRIV3|nr:protein ubiquitination [Trichomonas vaginalis G3]EAY07678.1 hypothetical protein TVAG_273620 [Trichomonas vaginalis G3]KAI5518521.1 protein ubiquitination [Trichomonas vaginalis G3]|eukprot:XP_001319901.1 hypothetical protein [Trichomonas vaginalis G3]